MDFAALLKEHGVTFEEELHVKAPAPTADSAAAAADLRAAVTSDAETWDVPPAPEVLATMLKDDQLARTLRARKFDQKKSLKLLRETIQWRSEVRPDLLRAGPLEDEARTGKTRRPGLDRHGRPLLVLDNTVENTSDQEGQMTYLRWNIENLAGKMKDGVEKQVTFIHLTDFSIFNTPPMSSTKHTMDLFANFYHERLGHCILWQPPAYFYVFLATVKPFIDAVTYSKVAIVRGDYSPGSKNDELMNLLIGENWRQLTGVDQPRETPKSSPGYVHEEYWSAVMKEDAKLDQKAAPKAPKPKAKVVDEEWC